MADEIKTGGDATLAGDVKLVLSPPPATEEGVTYGGCWIRAECDDEGVFSLRLFGTATYGNRPLTEQRNIEDLDPAGFATVKSMLQQVLGNYSEYAKNFTLASAYKARDYALNQGERLSASE